MSFVRKYSDILVQHNLNEDVREDMLDLLKEHREEITRLVKYINELHEFVTWSIHELNEIEKKGNENE